MPKRQDPRPPQGQDGSYRKGAAMGRAPCPVVGIGASAGGLEAFKAFLSSAPVDSGLAFVLVQHLAPDHRSILAELLQSVTAIPVHEIEGDIAVEPNQVYVIPQNTSLTITGGTLRLAKLAQPAGHRAPIDGFFISLAEDQGENAACVILSGGGHDGTQGLRAIKEHGGLVLVQSAETAMHDSMLRSAVQTGLVDFQLPVEEMPAKLRQYFDHLDDVQGKKDADGLRAATPQDLQRICDHLRARTGHDFNGYKESTLIRRIQRRMQVLEIDELQHYAQHLGEHGQEADLLFKDLLIGVTQFFRDRAAFEELAAKVVPNLLAQKGPGDEVRIWVAGCSTGEEVYSLAMLFCERAAATANPPNLQIFASDIDQNALHVARTGRYPRSIESDVSSERLEQFFVKEDGHYRVRNALREICLFAKHNLLNDPPFSRVDLVSCRNLMIFLNADLQQRVIPILHYALRPEGYLFLGPSESITQHAALFAPIAKKSRIFVARRDGLKHLPDLQLGQARSGRGPAAVAAGAKRLGGEPGARQQKIQRILENYAPAYVVVDADCQIVDSSRRTGRYLELGGGTPDLNVFNMARESLRLDLRAAIHQAIKSGRQVVRKSIEVEQGGGSQAITLTVEPLIGDEREGNHYVILFQPTDAEPPPHEPDRAEAGEAHAGYVQDLESQLRTAKEHLQTMMEELEASNEELRSSNEEFSWTNEELQSTNEELQTSKEELQSINEELHTVNAELNGRNDDLVRVNSDLKNLLENTQIATIFLDKDLGIRNFTRAAKDLFRLRDHDAGRPITDITLRFGYPQLEQSVREVMGGGSSIEREVSASDGPAGYLMRVMPYRTVDDVVDGAVLTFTDISERKRTEDHQTLAAGRVEPPGQEHAGHGTGDCRADHPLGVVAGGVPRNLQRPPHGARGGT